MNGVIPAVSGSLVPSFEVVLVALELFSCDVLLIYHSQR